MATINADNRILIKERERTYLTASAAVAGTVLTVKAVDTNSMADNDFIIVGEIGTETAEVMQINGAVADGTSLTIDNNGSGGLRYDHAIGEPVFRIDFNRVEFSRSATDTSVGASVLATNEIQPDDIFTRFDDTVNTTGFAFVRFNNNTAATFSSFSDGIPYAGQNAKSLAKMRATIRVNLDEPTDEFITDEMIDMALNNRQKIIAHERLWGFYELEQSFSTIANQFAYDLPTTIKESTVHSVTHKTQPLAKISRRRWDNLNWRNDTTRDQATHIHVWAGQLKVWPRPSSAATTTAINDGAGITATATSVTVDSTTSFERGDYFRFIIDSEVIYATGSTTTTFTGLLRGQEGTTAATHIDDATLTERDIVYTGQEEPVDLLDVNQETAIPEPLVLTDLATSDLAFKLERETTADRYLARGGEGLAGLRRRWTVKITGAFTRIKNQEELVSDNGLIRDLNEFPSDVG